MIVINILIMMMRNDAGYLARLNTEAEIGRVPES